MKNAEKEAIPTQFRLGLKLIGCYPNVSDVKRALLLFVFGAINVPFQILGVAEACRDVDLLMNCIGPLAVSVNYLFKFYFFHKNRKHVKFLLREVIRDYSDLIGDERNMMLANKVKSKFYYKLISTAFLSLGSSYFVTAFYSWQHETSLSDMSYVFPAVYPMIDRTLLSFTLLNLMQQTHVMIVSSGHALFECLLIILVHHAATKVYCVRNAIDEYFSICSKWYDRRVVDSAVKKLYCKHMAYLEFSKHVELVYSFVNLSHIMCMTLQLCATGYIFIAKIEKNSITEQLLLYLLFFVATIFATLTFCASGEYFAEQSYRIYEHLLESPWYNISIVDQKILLIIINKTQRSMFLTCGKFTNLNMITFTNVSKTAFSYLSVIRAMKNKAT